MRNPEFVASVFRSLASEHGFVETDSVVAVCANLAERELFLSLGFPNVVICGADLNATAEAYAPFTWDPQDAHDLTYADRSFDFAFVSDGLHHCRSPHRALLEMYRVARRGVVVVENRDSATMRLANRIGLSPVYEIGAVVANDFSAGGWDHGAIPNHIYRWTESEFKKTIRSFDPVLRQEFLFFYSLNLEETVGAGSRLRPAVRAADAVGRNRAFASVFKKQFNTIAMVALKPDPGSGMWPWLAVEEGEITLRRSYVTEGKGRLRRQAVD